MGENIKLQAAMSSSCTFADEQVQSATHVSERLLASNTMTSNRTSIRNRIMASLYMASWGWQIITVGPPKSFPAAWPSTGPRLSWLLNGMDAALLNSSAIVYAHAELSCAREDEKQWRAEDLEQRVLDNARAIWSRFTERTRYEVNERAEQLRSIGNLSALVAGFAMTSFLQFTFSNNEAVKAVILGFGISTAFVVSNKTLSVPGPSAQTRW